MNYPIAAGRCYTDANAEDACVCTRHTHILAERIDKFVNAHNGRPAGMGIDNVLYPGKHIIRRLDFQRDVQEIQ